MSPRIALLLALAARLPLTAQNYTISTFAGGGLPVNLTGTSADFSGWRAAAMALDKAGNLYFPFQNTILRMDVQTSLLTLVAGTGTAGYNGDNIPATSAQLNQPNGVAIDSKGNLYVCDVGNYRVRKISNGTISTVAGDGQSVSGIIPPTHIGYLDAVAVDPNDNLYLADRSNNVVWEVVGGNLTIVAGTGQFGFSGENVPATTAELYDPDSIAFDAAGNLYICDFYNQRVRKVSGGIITTVAGTGQSGYNGDNQPATSANLYYPVGVTVDAGGNLYIADMENGRIRKVSGGIITTVAGNGFFETGGDNGSALDAGIQPGAVALDGSGNLYINDINNHSIRKVTNGTITTVAGDGPNNGGPATQSIMGGPSSVALDLGGAVYIGDWLANRVWKVFNGVVTVVTGNGLEGDSGNNGPAGSAQVGPVSGLAVDSHGNLFIVEADNLTVREISNGTITLLAGPEVFKYPWGAAVDSHDNLYVADSEANIIFKLVNGVFTPLAGTGESGYNGDNIPALNAQLNTPFAVAVDAAGNLFIADGDNCRIREVSGGQITTVAGNGTCGYSGDNGPAVNAELSRVQGVAVDAAGNLYIADTSNNVIRKVSNGTITTIAGGGTQFGDGGPASGAEVYPWGLAATPSGDLFVADYANYRLRLLSSGPAVLSIAKVHSGNFAPGQTGATYQVTVSNALTAGLTSGAVQVIESLPSGLTLVSMSGDGWNCSNNTCSRSDILEPGSSYPAITVTVNVNANATSPQVNSVSVSGGGSASASTTDSTAISQPVAITIQTSPSNLQVSVDGGAPQTAPQTVSLLPGPHTIAVAGTQAGAAGTLYVFTHWSDNSTNTADNITVGNSAATYTATFKTQYQLTIAASPAAGGTVTPASGTFYDSGAAVPITATANAGYTFSGWAGSVANASNASTTATMSAAESVTANFASLTGITLQTIPTGLKVSVDGGAAQSAPVTLSLSQGSHTIAVATTQAGATGVQYVFTSWSDSGAASHSITVGSGAATYTSNFKTQYQLNLSASPASGGTVSPASGTFYDAGTVVPVSATANSGYVFGSWSGPVASATSASTSVTMSAAASITANFTTPSACSFTFSSPASLPATGTATAETCPNNSGQPNCGVVPETPASFTVTPSASCGAWTATSSNPEFLQITSGASGTGAGTVSYTLLTNTHTAPQTYRVTVASGGASATYSITEAGSGDSQVYREVYALYEQLLGRDPDAAGFAFWTGSGGAGLGQMADSFLTSPEVSNSGFAVMEAYQAATGNPPTFAQFTAAVASIRAGTQTVPGLFNSLLGAGYAAANLYQNLLGRAPAGGDSSCIASGLSTCFQTIIGYPSSTTPVGAVNNEFQSTGSFHTDHSNALYVRMVYYVTVSRDPDPAGFAFWVGVANQGGAGLLFEGPAGYATRIQILGPGTPNQGFIGSPEFQGLFAN